jgi:hypothetical protein
MELNAIAHPRKSWVNKCDIIKKTVTDIGLPDCIGVVISAFFTTEGLLQKQAVYDHYRHNSDRKPSDLRLEFSQQFWHCIRKCERNGKVHDDFKRLIKHPLAFENRQSVKYTQYNFPKCDGMQTLVIPFLSRCRRILDERPPDLGCF